MRLSLKINQKKKKKIAHILRELQEALIGISLFYSETSVTILHAK